MAQTTNASVLASRKTNKTQRCIYPYQKRLFQGHCNVSDRRHRTERRACASSGHHGQGGDASKHGDKKAEASVRRISLCNHEVPVAVSVIISIKDGYI